jgi:hypothetical protein
MTRHIRLVGIMLLFFGCASGPRAPSSAVPRIQDSAPEKIAAQRSAVPGLQLDEHDQRWGIEAARARRRAADQKKLRNETAPPAAGPVDLTSPSAALAQ